MATDACGGRVKRFADRPCVVAVEANDETFGERPTDTEANSTSRVQEALDIAESVS